MRKAWNRKCPEHRTATSVEKRDARERLDAAVPQLVATATRRRCTPWRSRKGAKQICRSARFVRLWMSLHHFWLPQSYTHWQFPLLHLNAWPASDGSNLGSVRSEPSTTLLHSLRCHQSQSFIHITSSFVIVCLEVKTYPRLQDALLQVLRQLLHTAYHILATTYYHYSLLTPYSLLLTTYYVLLTIY